MHRDLVTETVLMPPLPPGNFEPLYKLVLATMMVRARSMSVMPSPDEAPAPLTYGTIVLRALNKILFHFPTPAPQVRTRTRKVNLAIRLELGRDTPCHPFIVRLSPASIPNKSQFARVLHISTVRG